MPKVCAKRLFGQKLAQIGKQIGRTCSSSSPFFAFLVNFDTASTCISTNENIFFEFFVKLAEQQNWTISYITSWKSAFIMGRKNFLWIRFRNILAFERSIVKNTSIVEHLNEMKTLCDTIKFLSVFRQVILSKNRRSLIGKEIFT